MPATWAETVGDDFPGRVIFSRHFNCPTRLSAQHRVELVVTDLETCGRATLNDAELGELKAGDAESRFDVTTLLRPRNELAIEVTPPKTPGGSPGRSESEGDEFTKCVVGEVRLEISEGNATFD